MSKLADLKKNQSSLTMAKEQPKPPVMKIGQVDSQGNLTIRFSEEMIEPKEIVIEFYNAIFEVKMWVEEKERYVRGRFVN